MNRILSCLGGPADQMTRNKSGEEQVPTPDAAATLRNVLAGAPNAPAHWRSLGARLASHADMPAVWAQLAGHGDVALKVLDAVRQSFERAHEETSRQTSTEETEQLTRVKRLAADLKEAIERAPLPRNWAVPYELGEQGGVRTLISIGWRDVAGEVHPGAPLSIVDVLDLAVGLVDQHAASQAPRSLTRHSDQPFVRAFVRWLSWHLNRLFGSASGRTLAYLTNAALDLADPLDKDDVKAILKDIPAVFRSPKKGDLPP